MMDDIQCYYHNRTATEKCEECGKYLCVECKQVYRKAHSQGSEDSSSTYYTHHIYCPDCYEDKVSGIQNILGAIFPCIGFIIFISFVAAFGGFEFAPVWWTGGLIVMGLIIIGLLVFQIAIKIPNARKKALEIQNRAQEAYKQKKSTPSDSKVSQTVLNCRFCGAPVEIGKNICKYCGQTWYWKE